MNIKTKQIILLSLIFTALNVSAESMTQTLNKLQQDWAIANYQTEEAQLENVFETLNKNADNLIKAYPNQAEPLIWKAIILSTDAGKNGGLSALNKVNQARDALLAAEKINPEALDGSIYTSLGSLYYQVPGWPLAFGDDEKAKIYLEKALELNPDGIDSNYFYADYLLEQGDKTKAKVFFNQALNAPARVNRPLADKGRQAEIHQKLASLQK